MENKGDLVVCNAKKGLSLPPRHLLFRMVPHYRHVGSVVSNFMHF